LAFVLFFEELFEHVETLGPIALVEAQPLVRTGKRSGVKAAQMGAAAHLATDQPGVLQGFDVFRGSRKRNSKGFRKLTYRSLAKGEFAKHPSSRGVAQGVKDGIQLE
jgi:hypothetical protein